MNTAHFRRLGTHVPSGIVVTADSTSECDAHVYTGSIVNSIILPVGDGVLVVGTESKKCNCKITMFYIKLPHSLLKVRLCLYATDVHTNHMSDLTHSRLYSL